MSELHSDEAAPRLFECFPDRDQTDLPKDYLPEAEGVLIAGEAILRAIGYRPRSCRPRGWTKKDFANFSRFSRDCVRLLWVRGCGNFWVVQFNDHRGTHALVCALSRRPICTHTYQAAIRLAEYCDPIPQAPVAGYWAKVRPTWHDV